MLADEVKALTFDVFGTVVDWRTSVADEIRRLGERKGFPVDGEAFADGWRARYQPSMEAVRSGARGWTRLDELHRENLVDLLGELGIDGLGESEIDELNRAWHRLEPWPDSVAGLTALRTRYVLATLSNGNVALLVAMARHGGLPWDAILGAEPTGHYKPEPEAYLGTARFLDLEPHQCLMVAAHNSDLVAAGDLGFRTAFVARPREHGPAQTTDLAAEHDFDVVATDLVDLARKLRIAV